MGDILHGLAVSTPILSADRLTSRPATAPGASSSMRIALLFFAAAALAHANVNSPAVPFTTKERTQRYSDRVIVAKPHARHRGTVDASEARERVRVRNKLERLGDLRVIEVDAGETVEQAIERLKATGRYEFVEPDYLESLDATPNDANFTAQWSLHNTGQLTGSTPGADIKAVAAWDVIREAPEVIVAIVDSGINTTHRDLAPNLWRNPAPTFGDVNGAAFVRGVRSGTVTDLNGHGSHVAGIIGAAGNNTFNIAGVAWKVQLMAVRNSDSTGTSSSSDSAACIDYAVSKGAQIINCSFGGVAFSQAMITALRAAREAGVIVVASAGNDGADNDGAPHFPSNYLLDNIVSVGNSGPSDLPSGSSAFGGLVDLYAPGTSILSLDLTATGQVSRSGTSMSAPHVTGALALLRAQFPRDTARQLINRLLRGTARLSAFTGRAHSGGRLDLLGALTTTTNRPFNDDFATRAIIVGSGTTLRSNNTGATAEPGEPVHAGVEGATTLWWQWTAPARGSAAISTSGSGYDTALAVYTGTSVNALTRVAANDDADGATTSQVTFAAELGVTYHLAVTGKAGASGLTIVNVGTAPRNDDFANATTLASVESLQVAGTTFHATLQSGEPRIGTVVGGGSVWFKWTAPRAGRFQVASFTTAFDTVLGIYTGASADRLTLVAANDDTGIDDINSDSLCTFQAAAGATYHFKVDCKDPMTRGDFTLTLTDSAWQFSTIGAISGSPSIAPDGTIYVGGGTPDLNFYAVRPDGTSKWAYRAPGAVNNASAAVGLDGTITFGANDGTVTTLNPDGTVLWQRALGAGSLSVSPALGIDGTVYLHGTDGYLYALHPRTGATLWRTFVNALTFASAVIAADGTIYQASDFGFLYALRPDGSLKWRFTTNGDTFSTPALDAAGNIYLTTYSTSSLLCVAPDGTLRWSYTTPVLTFISGSPTLSADGTAAYFGASDRHVYAINTVDGSLRWRTLLENTILASSPAVDANGTLYIGCYDNRLYAIHGDGSIQRRWDTALPIRSSPAIAGRRLYFGSGDAKLYAIDLGAGPAAGTWTQYRQTPEHRGRISGGALAIAFQPRPVSTITSLPLLLAVGATGQDPMRFQWFRDGTALPGATLASYAVPSSAAGDAGLYSVSVSNPQGTVTSAAAAVALERLDPPRLANFSLRAVPGTGSQAMVVGFNVGPGNAKPLLVRGVGPTLSTLGVGGALADPVLTVTTGTTVLATSDNWVVDAGLAAATARAQAFPLDAASRDAALLRPFAPGRYGAELAGVNNTTGVALLELYETEPGPPDAATLSHLTNVSARGQVGTGAAILTAGFTVVGNVPRNLLIRAIGPALSAFGITGALADPVLEIYRGNTLIARNDDWLGSAALTTAFAQAGAFPLPATSLANSALVINLTGGVYTARVTGFGGATGVVLVEIYELP